MLPGGILSLEHAQVGQQECPRTSGHSDQVLQYIDLCLQTFIALALSCTLSLPWTLTVAISDRSPAISDSMRVSTWGEAGQKSFPPFCLLAPDAPP